MSNEIVLSNRGADLVSSTDDLARIGKAMAESGYFQDAKTAAQCAVKIMAGLEMGVGPFAAMTGVYIVKGKPAPGANLMASAVKTHPRYDYRVKRIDDEICTVEFFQDGASIGVSEFSKADAARAGTQNMGKFPRNMLFARAMSNGVRWYCPDVFNGAAAYTAEELGDDSYDVEAIPQTVRALPPSSDDRMDEHDESALVRAAIDELHPAPSAPAWLLDETLASEAARAGLTVPALGDYASVSTAAAKVKLAADGVNRAGRPVEAAQEWLDEQIAALNAQAAEGAGRRARQRVRG